MQFEKTLQVRAPASRVWEALRDGERLAALVPGCEEVRTIEPARRYAARVQERVGPFSARFELEVAVEPVEAGRMLRARIAGKDPRLGSYLQQVMTLTLEPEGDGATRVHMHTDVSVTGKLMSLAQGIIRRKAEEISEGFAQKFRAAMEGGAP